jgi:5,10-methylenetetrahydromethanopterin reductase
LRERAAEYAAAGITELVYQPAGPDIVGELARMMAAISDVTEAATAPTG